MSKKIILCAVFSMAVSLSAVRAAEPITLDLSRPVYPESFEFTNDVWTETYNATDYTYFEVQNFMFSHLPSAENYGGNVVGRFHCGTYLV